ncbi:MAG: NAD(P)H-dependent oxidoreductase [Chromatiales bacterium]|nr:MAG: NAD(P)H-dependent oxidoreductase [Chromatiales bacterium]
MATSITLIGLSGSLRHESLNTHLLRAAQERLPQGCTLVIESIAAIPLYNFDVETAHGIPGPVTALKDAIAAADGLLIASPEYNNSMPGVLKNAIDWLSRPAADIPRVFGNLPVAIMGATPGAFGTLVAQNAWLPVMRTLGARLWSGGRLVVPRASQLFDDAGHLTDEAMTKRLAAFVGAFVEDIRATRVT